LEGISSSRILFGRGFWAGYPGPLLAARLHKEEEDQSPKKQKKKQRGSRLQEPLKIFINSY
jgi:hypothetical protein